MNQLSINMQMAADAQFSLVKKNIEYLNPGDEIILTFTEDPSSLFEHHLKGGGNSIFYEYLDRGPSEWKVLVRKKLSEGCCGCCGGE